MPGMFDMSYNNNHLFPLLRVVELEIKYSIKINAIHFCFLYLPFFILPIKYLFLIQLLKDPCTNKILVTSFVSDTKEIIK